MRLLIILAALFPTVAWAHGGHPPMAEPAHHTLHVMVVAGFMVALAVIAGRWVLKRS